uniref:heme-binding protein 2 n=1 Tax=Doryrhamphus excisus TaxID=161450 RepID=UPI0025AE6036|nr:heme-binding protein 2 [Doryrhamphus excisus]
MFLAGLVVFLLALTAEAEVGDSSKVSFCTETEECLLFDVICETEYYEVRHYKGVKWVAATETSYIMEFAAMSAFKQLYKYIDGENENGQKIEMTSPVVVKIVDKKFWQMGAYTVSFLLPKEHQANPPKPTNPNVKFYDTEEAYMYVRSYGGLLTSMSDKKEAGKLMKALKSYDASFKSDCHYGAAYNGPMTLWNRHNEVWFVAEGEPVCYSSEEMGPPY